MPKTSISSHIHALAEKGLVTIRLEPGGTGKDGRKFMLRHHHANPESLRTLVLARITELRSIADRLGGTL